MCSSDLCVRPVLPHRRGGALRHAVPGGGACRRAVPAPAPAVPQQAACRAKQLLPAAAVAGRQHALSLSEIYGIKAPLVFSIGSEFGLLIFFSGQKRLFSFVS